MNRLSSFLPGTLPPKTYLLEEATVSRPSALRAWWSDDGATEPAVSRANKTFQFGPIGHYRAKNVTILPDSYAFNDEGMLLDHDIKLGAYRKMSKMPRIVEKWQRAIDGYASSGKRPRRISEPTMMGISQGGRRIWGHWVVQNLAKCLFFLENFPEGKIAVPDTYFGQYANFGDSLLRAGCPRSRLVILESTEPHIFDELIIVDYLYGPHIIHPEAVRLLSAAGERMSRDPEAQTSRIPPAKRIFIPRTVGGSRDIVNADEIAALAVKHGFSIIPLGKFSVVEQVRAWREAEAVVSVCGSDLANMVFAEAPLRIGSLTPTWFKDIFFVDLASAKGFDWYELFCSVTPDPGTHSSRRVYVDPGLADKLFAALTL